MISIVYFMNRIKMNLVTIITIAILIVGIIYYLTRFRISEIGNSFDDSIFASVLKRYQNGWCVFAKDIIGGRQTCDISIDNKGNQAWECQSKCIETVAGGLTCDGTYSCNGARIRPSSQSDNVVCIGHDSCNHAYIYGDAICNGQKSCRSATITGNAFCTSEEACIHANIQGTKMINNYVINNGKRINAITWTENWWNPLCVTKNTLPINIKTLQQQINSDIKCAKGPLECTGQYSCFGLIIDGKATCTDFSACFYAKINGNAICNGLESCKQASISGNAVCDGKDACKDAYIHGNACCTSDKACPQNTKVIGTKTINAHCA